jgi:predicted ATPase
VCRAAGALLAWCARVRILATSREPLGVDGETLWRPEPLGVVEAHRLFVERARQRDPRFIPSKDVDATIAQVCARLDRLPLAIELAAARVGVMSPSEILSGIEVRLGDPAGGSRLAPAHHRSVRAVVEWSHRLLDRTEQRAFRSLGVFVGGFDAAAAVAVAPGMSLDVLARLVDKSLITPSEGRRGRTRYRLIETVREFAHELLVEAGELDDARARHLRHFAAFGDLAREGWPSATAQQLVDDIEDDYENVRAALEWAADFDPCSAMRPLARLYDLFMMVGQADGLRLGRLVLERCPTRDSHRAELQISAGVLTMLLADTEGTRKALAEAYELSAELGERALKGWARLFQGLSATLEGSINEGREHLEAARALHRELGVRIGEARSTATLGLGFELAGESRQAKALV